MIRLELVSNPIAGDRERGRPAWRAGPSPVTVLVGPSTKWGCSRAGPAPDTGLKPVQSVERSAVAGLTRVARRAGRYDANSAVVRSTAVTVANVVGSTGPTP
jgi:hypothetical protein